VSLSLSLSLSLSACVCGPCALTCCFGGRKHFVFAAVEYLFGTTYEASDELTVSALVGYVNAAVPPDKHEDFDTGEVTRAAHALCERARGWVVLEGDVLRLVE
jgi:hypothetical protein